MTTGQTASFNYYNLLNHASGPLMGSSFTGTSLFRRTALALIINIHTVLKRPGNVSFGVSQKIGGTFQSIYLGATPVSNGPEVFTSTPTVIVFLSRGLNTGTKISNTFCVTVPISFTANLEQRVSYVTDPAAVESGIWIIGRPPTLNTSSATGPGARTLSLAVASGKLSAMTPHQYSVENGFELMGHGFDAFKMAELINFYTHDFKPAGGDGMS